MSQQTNVRPLFGAAGTVIALMVAVAAVVWTNQLSFSIVFAVLWRRCTPALGLYRRSSELLRPALISAAGVSLMAGLLFFSSEVSRRLRTLQSSVAGGGL
jgi:hypothetical protein